MGTDADQSTGSGASAATPRSPGPALWELARPFTLVAPALGIASGAITAWGAGGCPPLGVLVWVGVAVACLAAALLNGGSNTVNQVADRHIDAINKPARPLPSGRISPLRAALFGVALYGASLAIAFSVNLWTGALFAGGALLSVAYSVPPLRLKRHWLLANSAIATARGLLLKVAGWATVADPLGAEPWLIGLVFAAFNFGAINTKDFADVAGDRAGGISTLVARHGPAVAARVSAPFFVLPFAALPVLAWTGALSGNPWALTVLGGGLALYGGWAARLALAHPEELGRENHPSWRHMYLMMFLLQVGFAVAYVV